MRNPTQARSWPRRTLLFLGVSVVGACADAFAPLAPDEAVPLAALPAEYVDWWSIVEECSELTAPFADVAWSVLPGAETIPGRGDAIASYYAAGNEVVLTEGRERDGFLVRHEMLHAILAARGEFGHQRAFFETRCGGVVSCGGRCDEEVGDVPVSALGAPRASSRSMDVMVRVLPESTTPGGDPLACVTIVVSARNKATEAVALDLRDPEGFGWIIDSWGAGSGGGPVPPNDIVLLEPFATRRSVFDCPVPIGSFPPGEYLVRGRFRRARSEAVALTVGP